jgi:putative copper export protein
LNESGKGLRSVAALGGLMPALLWASRAEALPGGAHPSETLDPVFLATGLVHGIAQGSAVFLAGLAVFVPLVWLPASKRFSAAAETALFVRGCWFLLAVLCAAGVAEVALYVARISGESPTFGSFAEALFGTGYGGAWLARVGFGLAVAGIAGWGYAARRPGYWWASAAAGAVVLFTIVQQGHAASFREVLPLLSSWLHVLAVAVWLGGLLGFPLALAGPLRALDGEERAALQVRLVRRFSTVATFAVAAVVLTGIYASLLHLPGPAALVETLYGRVLVMKVGLFVVLLAAGGINLLDRGRGPFGRMVGAEFLLAALILLAVGFLSSLEPPA